MQKSGKVVAKAAAAPAAKKATAAKAPAKKTTAKKGTYHESAKTRHLAAVKAAKTRARNKAAKAKARALEPGMAYDGCVITALAARLHLAGLSPSYGALMAAFRGAGGRPEGGVPIPAMLCHLAGRGLIAGFAPVDIHPELLEEPGLILGVSLPGPHAVLTVPAILPAVLPLSRAARPSPDLGAARWLSWGTIWDPAFSFPDAAVEEAWRLW